jgi:hypothetical protein
MRALIKADSFPADALMALVKMPQRETTMRVLSCLIIVNMIACSNSSSKSSSSAASLTGTWDLPCTAYESSEDGSDAALIAASYLKGSLIFAASTYTVKLEGFSDAACANRVSATSDVSTYTLGDAVEGTERAVNFDQVNTSGGARFYDIIQYDKTSLMLGKKDTAHDGTAMDKRPVELEDELVYTKEEPSETSNESDADCVSSEPASLTYTATDATYTVPSASTLECGYYTQLLGSSSVIGFDVTGDENVGGHAPFSIQLSGYPLEAKTYTGCTFTFDDGAGNNISTDSGTVTISSISGGTITGTFEGSGLSPVVGSGTIGSITGTFTVEEE